MKSCSSIPFPSFSFSFFSPFTISFSFYLSFPILSYPSHSLSPSPTLHLLSVASITLLFFFCYFLILLFLSLFLIPFSSTSSFLCIPYPSLPFSFVIFVFPFSDFFLCEFREDSVKQEENPSTKGKKNDERPEQQSESVYQHSYSYSGLHMFMSLSSFYVITFVTNWYQVDIDGGHVTYRTSTVAMVVLMSTTFVCLWIFTWILVKPVWLGFIKRFCKGDFDQEKTTNNMETGLTGLEPKASEAVCHGSGHDIEGEFKGATNFEARETVEDVDPEANNCKAAPKLCEVGPLGLSIEREMDKIIEDSNDLEKNKKVVDGQVKKEKEANSKNEREMEMIRLQEKVLRLQDKIGKLQYKVAELQGVSL